jgi:hypothetical protein
VGDGYKGRENCGRDLGTNALARSLVSRRRIYRSVDPDIAGLRYAQHHRDHCHRREHLLGTSIVLRFIKRMGRMLDAAGRSYAVVPMEIWTDPDELPR